MEYIFFQIVDLRVRQGYELDEAAHTAAIFMTAPLLALVVAIDLVVSRVLDTTPLFQIIGKWPYGICLFLCFYLWHYYRFIRRGRTLEILRRFGSDSVGGAKAMAVVGLYILGMPIVSIVLGFLLR